MCLLLSELLRTSHQIVSIPEIPIIHEQPFIRIALSPLDSLESPLLLETLLILRELLHRC